MHKPKKDPTHRAVLVVDDHPDLRRMVVRMLGRAGIGEVDEADCGEVCLALCGGFKYDVILMDLTMPGMDGYATFLELRKIDPDVVTILSSGWSATEIAERTAETPPAALLAKPFTAEDLVSTLTRLGLWR